jgi:prepilin-type N-terminal cleavage/methylation domain-containing protein
MKRRSAFTLSEIMVVLVVIVLLLALAVPAFNLIRGSRSVEGAQNQLAAMIGRARADAIGLQKPYGVLLFMNDIVGQNDARDISETGPVYIAEVYASDFPDAAANPQSDVYLDIVPDTEFLTLPPGVMGMVLNNNAGPTGTGYLGYRVGGGVVFGGVILFGGDGRLITRNWGVRTGTGTGNATKTRVGEMMFPGTGNNPPATGFLDVWPTQNPALASTSLGFVLFDKQAFFTNYSSVSILFDPTTATQWINDNATPILINRYNGTLMRGE